jgi:hypothetical protein
VVSGSATSRPKTGSRSAGAARKRSAAPEPTTDWAASDAVRAFASALRAAASSICRRVSSSPTCTYRSPCWTSSVCADSASCAALPPAPPVSGVDGPGRRREAATDSTRTPAATTPSRVRQGAPARSGRIRPRSRARRAVVRGAVRVRAAGRRPTGAPVAVPCCRAASSARSASASRAVRTGRASGPGREVRGRDTAGLPPGRAVGTVRAVERWVVRGAGTTSPGGLVGTAPVPVAGRGTERSGQVSTGTGDGLTVGEAVSLPGGRKAGIRSTG